MVTSRQRVDGKPERASVRVPSQGGEQWLGSLRVSGSGERGGHQPEAVGRPGRRGHRPFRTVHDLLMLAASREQYSQIHPADPEAGIELDSLPGVGDRFVRPSHAGAQIRPPDSPHLAERILFNHAIGEG